MFHRPIFQASFFSFYVYFDVNREKTDERESNT